MLRYRGRNPKPGQGCDCLPNAVCFSEKDEALSKRRDKNENAQEQGVSQGETFLNAADEFLEFVTRLDRIIIINCLGSLHPAR